MWADNETEVDLLGFDYLVDSLIVALTEPRLLPLTVGVLGDWGSGKSSLIAIARANLEGAATGDPPRRYISVGFSPWQHEDYEDVKTALMTAVLDRLADEVPDQAEQIGRLRQTVRSLRRRTRWLGRAALGTAPAAVPLVAGPHLDPAAVAVAQAGVQALAAEVGKALETPGEVQDSPPPDTDEVAAFRRQFRELLDELKDIAAVVVFIDDLDRCLPDTVVDTFEAIRLFLNTPKTAYVVAANQAVVESAIDSRYPDIRRPDGTGIGADYLEKMIQLKVAIPALSPPEAETYINLLLAELHLGQVAFDLVLSRTRERRATNNLTVAFNMGIAGDVLGDAMPGSLADDLTWAATIAPALSSGLRGNPRQIKRFLNTLQLRSRAAARRGVELRADVLAKLHVLEDQHIGDFQRVFDWQILAAGPAPQLAAAEALVRGEAIRAKEDEEPKGTSDGEGRAERRPAVSPSASEGDEGISDWVSKPHVRRWIALAPKLGDVDLRPYFTYSRDRLSLGVSASRLSPKLQTLLAQLQDEIDHVRRKALESIEALPDEERSELLEALVDVLVRRPAGPAWVAAVELAERVPATSSSVVEALARVPAAAVPVPGGVIAAIRRLPKGDASVEGLFDSWESSGIESLAGITRSARAPRKRPR